MWVEGLPRRSGEPSSRSSSLGVVRRFEQDATGWKSEIKKGCKGIGLNEQKKTYMSDALCSILTTFLIILADFGGTLSHVLSESMAWSRKPLEGREVRYRYGWRTT